MPLIVWFLAWWFMGFPAVHMWDAWSVSLVIVTLWTIFGD